MRIALRMRNVNYGAVWLGRPHPPSYTSLRGYVSLLNVIIYMDQIPFFNVTGASRMLDYGLSEVKKTTVCQAFIMNSDERREARLRTRRERRAAESSQPRETRLARHRVVDRADQLYYTDQARNDFRKPCRLAILYCVISTRSQSYELSVKNGRGTNRLVSV